MVNPVASEGGAQVGQRGVLLASGTCHNSAGGRSEGTDQVVHCHHSRAGALRVHQRAHGPRPELIGNALKTHRERARPAAIGSATHLDPARSAAALGGC